MEKGTIGPLKFRAVYKSKIWGSESWGISDIPGSESVVSEGEYAGQNLTELIKQHGKELLGTRVLEKCGQDFPLLMKVIDAKDKLSIQVHPNDEMAQRVEGLKYGKNEMWYVLSVEKEAYIITGFKRYVGREEYLKRVEENTLEEVLYKKEVKQGDVIYIPAGSVHAIGAGCRILEVQQSSDTTYRIYDYNRKDAEGKSRELHTEKAVEAINYEGWKNQGVEYHLTMGEVSRVIDTEHFITSILEFEGEKKLDLSKIDSCAMITCVEGEIEGLKLEETILVAAQQKQITLKSRGIAKIFIAVAK